LSLEDIYVFGGASISTDQLENENLLGYTKRFHPGTNGCSQHGIPLNERLYEAHRNRTNLVGTAIDFTNAFGSVPHELIMSTMEQRNFPSWMRDIVADLYKGASSVIEKRGTRSGKIPWKRG
jgi:hypothetical protein